MGLFEPSPAPYAVEKLFLQLIDKHAQRDGSKPALLWQEGELSWRALDKRSNQVARALISSGAEKGQRAAIAGSGSAEYVVALLGILKAGLSAVPLSTMATPQLMVSLLQDSAAEFLFTDRHSLDKFGEAILQGKRALVGLDFSDADWQSLVQWREKFSTNRPDINCLGSDEFNVIYSSGTTGTPKGIVHSHQVRSTQVHGFQPMGLSADSITVLTTVLYTNYSMLALFATLAVGGTVYLMPRFREEDFLALCGNRKVSHAFLVPVQIGRLLDHKDFDHSMAGGAMTIISAGSPLSVARKKEVIARWPGVLLEIYGSTEGGGSTVLVASQYLNKLNSVGTPGNGHDIRIISEQGDELPAGETGEIVGRSPTMMSGYLNREQETRALIWRSPQGDVFIRSGDIGYFDTDGFLYLTDRKKDVIISGGINVYAVDIEDILNQHPDVADCAVVATPSYRRDEAPIAFVVPTADSTISSDALLAWLNKKLARHQHIEDVVFRKRLPRNAMGKVLKRELRLELKD